MGGLSGKQAPGAGHPDAQAGDDEHSPDEAPWYETAWGNVGKQFLAEGYETADDLNTQDYAHDEVEDNGENAEDEA